MGNETILVVDDNPTNLKLIAFLLKTHGFVVLTAVDAEAALASIARQAPRLIVMDLQLPGMNGLELTRLIKADPRTAHIFIVALTAFAMKGDEARALESGCDRYFTKPIDTRTLPMRLRELLSASPAEPSP